MRATSANSSWSNMWTLMRSGNASPNYTNRASESLRTAHVSVELHEVPRWRIYNFIDLLNSCSDYEMLNSKSTWCVMRRVRVAMCRLRPQSQAKPGQKKPGQARPCARPEVAFLPGLWFLKAKAAGLSPGFCRYLFWLVVYNLYLQK